MSNCQARATTSSLIYGSPTSLRNLANLELAAIPENSALHSVITASLWSSWMEELQDCWGRKDDGYR